MTRWEEEGKKPLKIVSGAQTGVDQGALGAGILLGWPIGGFAPKSWQTEKGFFTIPEVLQAHMVEIDGGYVHRTKMNVEQSDGTLIFHAVESVGTRLTIIECRAAKKPRLDFKLDEAFGRAEHNRLEEWLHTYSISVLNVAGHRETKWPGAKLATCKRLCGFFGLRQK